MLKCESTGREKRKSERLTEKRKIELCEMHKNKCARGRKVCERFAYKAHETHGCVDIDRRNDTRGRVDMKALKRGKRWQPKKASVD